ncbi:hypothetical protein J4G43_052925 (plasmid) [Bradyrhizobium barranii subsp. barranii]|uniref:Protein CR006 P-loop domain-containing protein n=1 Tax=Bradyrhizobium barranii subsp. barranii TaxID=2823807 RepID=A0A939MJV3_9BRAD|nr:hypothetical protein [Bradyrhizobium barranii]UEM17930.1 hypothetical protein J4G43_052925 [Bradyrhizobium barranii subsp. barranii]
MAVLNIKISNCNSVDLAAISITEQALNIKYGPNGLGKSSLARAIVSHIKADGSIKDLIPFKHRGTPGAGTPTVEGADSFRSALVFDEDYVDQFVFQKDEVVKNSFDIFIRTPEYLTELAEIDDLLSGIRQAFADNADIGQVVKDLMELREAFGKPSKSGALAKNSKIHKAFGSGNKIANIPNVLKPFETFIKSKEPAKWISWQIKGNEFLSLGDNCPYCSSTLAEAGKKDTALAVEKEYDASAVGHIKASLRDKTTLMLTHDIEPAIDVIKSTSSVFQAARPSAAFLSSRAGVISEVPIQRDDIQTFAKICKDNIALLSDPLLQAIYLRRQFELQDDMGLEYNLLASLFKRRDVPTIQSATDNRPMTASEKAEAESKICVHLPGFDYDILIADTKSVATIKAKFHATTVGYEKIQLFRILGSEHDHDVIRKFINESYHIENEYVMQLNPHRFEIVPEYVVEECTRLLPA